MAWLDLTAFQAQRSAKRWRAFRQAILLEAHQRRGVVRHDCHPRVDESPARAGVREVRGPSAQQVFVNRHGDHWIIELGATGPQGRGCAWAPLLCGGRRPSASGLWAVWDTRRVVHGGWNTHASAPAWRAAPWRVPPRHWPSPRSRGVVARLGAGADETDRTRRPSPASGRETCAAPTTWVHAAPRPGVVTSRATRSSLERMAAKARREPQLTFTS